LDEAVGAVGGVMINLHCWCSATNEPRVIADWAMRLEFMKYRWHWKPSVNSTLLFEVRFISRSVMIKFCRFFKSCLCLRKPHFKYSEKSCRTRCFYNRYLWNANTLSETLSKSTELRSKIHTVCLKNILCGSKILIQI
jgi:hypothetical protein